VSAAPITVEVVFATRTRQWSQKISLPAGATVADAIAVAGTVLGADAMTEVDQNDVGVWGRLVSPDSTLQDGDRLEFLRRLTADPKDARRRREEVRRRKG
jgi:putative ubiquitin-RnfH superfamily antitoxin RatB of RatAB toxin-antitoxin module